jgi:DNA-binding transcriptional regulator YiaG
MGVYECSKCGAEAKVVRGNYAMKESGLPRVVLQGIQIIRCPKCGNEDPIIPHLDDLMGTLAFAVVMKPYRLTGEEIRFLRKYVLLTQEAFSRMLRVDKTTLSKWENNDDPIGEQSDLLVRCVAVALGGPGLKGRLEEAVRQFENIKDRKKRVGFQVNAETREVEYA